MNGHHPWCNGNSNSPIETCRWCSGPNGFLARYPKEEDLILMMESNEKWCMCTELEGVARDTLSTCMICGGKDAYGGSPDRGNEFKKVLSTNSARHRESSEQLKPKIPTRDEMWNHLKSLPIPSAEVLLSGKMMMYYVDKCYEYMRQHFEQ